jgi:hypothetical protein
MLAVAEKVTRLDEGASWTYVEALEAVGQATADKRRLTSVANRLKKQPGRF